MRGELQLVVLFGLLLLFLRPQIIPFRPLFMLVVCVLTSLEDSHVLRMAASRRLMKFESGHRSP